MADVKNNVQEEPVWDLRAVAAGDLTMEQRAA
jgi:hypothetical protein